MNKLDHNGGRIFHLLDMSWSFEKRLFTYFRGRGISFYSGVSKKHPDS